MPKGNGKMYNDKYNAPDNYTDMDGMTKTFTHIDYSGKKSFSVIENLKEMELRNKNIKENTIKNIVEINPSTIFLPEYQIRGGDKISWNEELLKNESIINLIKLKNKLCQK